MKKLILILLLLCGLSTISYAQYNKNFSNIEIVYKNDPLITKYNNLVNEYNILSIEEIYLYEQRIIIIQEGNDVLLKINEINLRMIKRKKDYILKEIYKLRIKIKYIIKYE